ncbi:MAG: 4Fe-4S dicluster domain-containing protein [Bacillota bacterium]|nr:4Fe-4S dicluster domain-containing protein [Bacillota bacterium]
MEQYVVLNKNDFDDFIDILAKLQKLVAPVKRGEKNYAFDEVTSSSEIALKYIPTILPPKKYFLPQNETLVEYNKKQNKREGTLYSEPLTIFGVHTCDLAGIQCLNIVFSDRPMDANYNLRKKKILVIGLECNEYCDEYASCALMHNQYPNGGYDLFFTELENKFIIHVNTLSGEELIKKMGMIKPASEEDMKGLEQLRIKKRKIFKPEIDISYSNLHPLFEKSFNNDVWNDIGNRCLSCTNCTNVCPTCYCYDMGYDTDLDMNSGSLIRKWDSCQSRPFATVAGGESFRPERAARQRHRYMRKFNYAFDKYNRYFCTGCGRCSRTCMAKINLKETINTLIKTVKAEK